MGDELGVEVVVDRGVVTNEDRVDNGKCEKRKRGYTFGLGA